MITALPTPLQFHGTDRPAALHRVESLNEFLSTHLHRPTVLTDTGYAALSDLERHSYNRSRLLYLSGGILIGTPSLLEAKLLLGQCFAENIGRNSGHAGLMLDGDSTLGKTTIAKALMQWVYAQYQRQFPDFRSFGQVPVVYIEVPAGSTGKLLMKTFAEFFGLTVRSGESMVSIRNRVVDTMNAARTQLVVVDELHFLANRNAGNGESVDLLKNLHNDLPSTFLYAGVGINGSGLLSGPRGQQLGGRFSVLEMQRFNLSKPGDPKAWRSIISQFEKALPLHHHEIGTLPAMAEYLFERTNGSIGSLGKLLTGAAAETVNNPNIVREEITKALLETRRLAHSAEDTRNHARLRNNNPMTVTNILKGLTAS